MSLLKRTTAPPWKDLESVVNIVSVRETGSILKIGFALSKWSHLHRAYVLAVCRVLSTTVHKEQKICYKTYHLRIIRHPSRIHSRSHIYCISPNVILGFARTYRERKKSLPACESYTFFFWNFVLLDFLTLFLDH